MGIYTVLPELIDNQQFARKLKAIMVRRLKSELEKD